MMKRPYFEHRQAYAPRLWPLILSGILIMQIPILLLPNSNGVLMFIAILIILFIGVGVVEVRWWIWRRQHPVISAEELLQARRDAAKWN